MLLFRFNVIFDSAEYKLMTWHCCNCCDYWHRPCRVYWMINVILLRLFLCANNVNPFLFSVVRVLTEYTTMLLNQIIWLGYAKHGQMEGLDWLWSFYLSSTLSSSMQLGSQVAGSAIVWGPLYSSRNRTGLLSWLTGSGQAPGIYSRDIKRGFQALKFRGNVPWPASTNSARHGGTGARMVQAALDAWAVGMRWRGK